MSLGQKRTLFVPRSFLLSDYDTAKALQAQGPPASQPASPYRPPVVDTKYNFDVAPGTTAEVTDLEGFLSEQVQVQIRITRAQTERSEEEQDHELIENNQARACLRGGGGLNYQSGKV